MNPIEEFHLNKSDILYELEKIKGIDPVCVCGSDLVYDAIENEDNEETDTVNLLCPDCDHKYEGRLIFTKLTKLTEDD